MSAAPISEAEQAGMNDVAREKQDAVLAFLATNAFVSLADTAAKLGWKYSSGSPDKTTVNRVLVTLKTLKRVEMEGTRYVLSPAGKKAVSAAKRNQEYETVAKTQIQ